MIKLYTRAECVLCCIVANQVYPGILPRAPGTPLVYTGQCKQYVIVRYSCGGVAGGSVRYSHGTRCCYSSSGDVAVSRCRAAAANQRVTYVVSVNLLPYFN